VLAELFQERFDIASDVLGLFFGVGDEGIAGAAGLTFDAGVEQALNPQHGAVGRVLELIGQPPARLLALFGRDQDPQQEPGGAACQGTPEANPRAPIPRHIFHELVDKQQTLLQA
jgi:hypothetical protein